MAVIVAGCNQPAVVAIGLSACGTFAVGECGWASVGKTVRWLAPLAVLVAVLNPLLQSSGSTELFRIGHQGVYLEAAVYGLVMAGMLAAMVLLFLGFSAAVGASELRDLLGRRMPVCALILSLGLRLVPQMSSRQQSMSATDKANTAFGNASLRDLLGRRMPVCALILSLGLRLVPQMSSRQQSMSATDKANTAFGNASAPSVGALSTRLMAWSLDDSLVQADSKRARGCAARRRVTAAPRAAPGGDRGELGLVLALGIAAAVTALTMSAGWTFYPAMPPLTWSWGYALVGAVCLVPVLGGLRGAVRERRALWRR